jgi:D-alanyl-D-alanine carboxypeptidase
MTLYLLFEQLEKGRLTLESPIPISAHAAVQAPSKLGLAPGDTISVEDAIKAVVTRSANDIAVAIAEKVGGDEENFAEMMTQKAHALGMGHTFYHNASGLPDERQITTAHDLTILARAVQERFPRYFHYFSTHSFEYAGEVIGNHNHLLGRVDGVDGIKTGYTNASGFNLMTSMHKDGRSIVAVVMGGRSAASRDRTMEELLYQHFAEAAAGGRTAPMIAEASAPEPPAAETERPRVAALPPRAPIREARVEKADMEAESEAEGDDDDRSDASAPSRVSRPAAPIEKVALATPPSRVVEPLPPAPADPAGLAWAKGPEGALPAAATRAIVRPVAAPIAPPEPPRSVDPAKLGWVKGPEPAPQAHAAPAPKPEPAAKLAAVEETKVAKSEDARPVKDGWKVQIGATDAADKASDMLNRAKAENRGALALAKPFTERVQKGESTLYRARFAVVDASAAETACRSLKRTGFSCFATRD